MSGATDRLAVAKSRLGLIKYQAQRIAELTLPASQASQSPTPLVDYALAELGGSFSQNLFGRKRPGQAVARSLVRKSRAAERRRETEEAKQQAEAILFQVDGEIRSLEGAIKESERQRLLRLLVTARSSARPQTMALRCARVIDILQATEAVSAPPIRPTIVASESTDAEGATILRLFERELREFIAKELSKQSATWWDSLVPQLVRDSAEHRRGRGEVQWPWAAPEENDLIHFVDFKDYSKIITEEGNWNAIFESVFGDLEYVRMKLRELEPIRVEIAHSRRLSVTNLDKLKLYAAELSNLMRRHGNG